MSAPNLTSVGQLKERHHSSHHVSQLSHHQHSGGQGPQTPPSPAKAPAFAALGRSAARSTPNLLALTGGDASHVDITLQGQYQKHYQTPQITMPVLQQRGNSANYSPARFATPGRPAHIPNRTHSSQNNSATSSFTSLPAASSTSNIVVLTDQADFISHSGWLGKRTLRSTGTPTGSSSMLSLAAASLRSAMTGNGSGGGGSSKKTDRHFRLSPLTTWKPGVVVWWFSYHESEARDAKEKWGCSVEDIVRVGRVPGGSNGNYSFMVVSSQRTLELIAPTQSIVDTWIRQLELARSSTRRALLIQQQESQPAAGSPSTAASAPNSPPDSLNASSNSEPGYRPHTFAASASNVSGGDTRQSSGTATPTQANPTGMSKSSNLRKSLSANALVTAEPASIASPSPPQRTLAAFPPARDGVRQSRSVTFDAHAPAHATLQPVAPMASGRMASSSQNSTDKALSGIADALEQTMADLQRFAQTEVSPTSATQPHANVSMSGREHEDNECDEDADELNDAAILASSIRPPNPARATPPPVQRQFRLSPDSPEHPPLPSGLRMSSASAPTSRPSQQPQTPPAQHQRPSSMATSIAPSTFAHRPYLAHPSILTASFISPTHSAHDDTAAAAAVRRRTSSESDRTLHRNTDAGDAHHDPAAGDRYSVIIPTPRTARPPSPIHGSAQDLLERGRRPSALESVQAALPRPPIESPPALVDADAPRPPDKVLERQPTAPLGGDRPFRPLTVTLVTDGLDWNIMDALAMLNGSPTSPKETAVPPVPRLPAASVPVLQQQPVRTYSGKSGQQVISGPGDGLFPGDLASGDAGGDKRGEEVGSTRAHV